LLSNLNTFIFGALDVSVINMYAERTVIAIERDTSAATKEIQDQLQVQLSDAYPLVATPTIALSSLY
jgi:hypothetical protein